MRSDLGHLSDIDIVNALVEVDGKLVLDIGCGAGSTARLLVAKGATVVGYEPDPVQAQRNRDAPALEGLSLKQAPAEALPQADQSVDGAFFFRSLHHVPAEAMPLALAEARRVVKPGGFVFVLEPHIEGGHTRMMLPFHDEGDMRTLAQAALDTAAAHFGERRQFSSKQSRSYESFDAMCERFCLMSFNHFTPEMIDVPAVRERFEAARIGEAYVFEQPVLVDVFGVR